VIRAALFALGSLLAAAAAALFLAPRPPDTTDPAIFAADGAGVDYCELPELDGSGATAVEIPRAYTPGCGWERWPMPVLAGCTEALAPGVADLRGLWRSTSPAGLAHVERIEQCGNRTVVTSAGVIHDFVADGTLANGPRDVSGAACMNVWVAVEWRDGVQRYHPFGLPFTIVTRALDTTGEREELVWHHPRLGEVRMERICEVPDAHRAGGGGSLPADG